MKTTPRRLGSALARHGYSCLRSLHASPGTDRPRHIDRYPYFSGRPGRPGRPGDLGQHDQAGAQLEGGATINPQDPPTSNNFGQLFTDKANTALLNQLILSAQRLPDPKATDYDFGFQVQALYGSDARYVQFMGELNSTFASRYQLAFINANVQAHLPWLTAGGIDLKVGQFPTPVGYEVIDASLNPFYSHSYIFNFGLPFVATGIQAITHVNDVLDFYAGVDTGVNTTFGAGDNNSAVAGMTGVNLTFLDGKLTVLALTHFGPENPTRTVPVPTVHSGTRTTSSPPIRPMTSSPNHRPEFHPRRQVPRQRVRRRAVCVLHALRHSRAQRPGRDLPGRQRLLRRGVSRQPRLHQCPAGLPRDSAERRTGHLQRNHARPDLEAEPARAVCLDLHGAAEVRYDRT